MNLFGVIFLTFLATTWGKDCPTIKSNSKLFCYYSKLTDINSCECSHVILPADADIKSIDRLREAIKGVKILISVNEFNQGLVNILKESKVDGLEINLKKLNSKEDINDFISTVRSKLGSDLYIVLSVPPKNEILAKFFDFKSLSKSADLFILQTAFLGANKNVTFHPSRLSGLWDMQNTDSVVDLVTGLGAPLSKLVVAAPVQAFQFTLQNSEYTAPGSPALEVKSINRNELCALMKNGKNWTLERDQDQAGPYIFSGNQWIAFEDSISMDIKAKYSRVRGLAGLALKDLTQDGGSKCESSILESAYNGLSRQSRAPRGAVLHSLEREILETNVRPLDNIQVSPYRISRVIDTEGHVHSIRQDTRTEFSCSRQGYFVHPRSCNRFYRCVKFDQLSDEFSVFEFDCPAGLAFDERVEVCVWPGSLPHASACAGSSEIAPVPRERFICPTEPGYYADPENCRWFFACLDHGKSPLSAYEFRCPFGLVFDQDRLMCEWPWFVPKCANGEAFGLNLATQNFYGTAFALEQYDGLGSLGVVKLGGLSGSIQKPVAKVYSNAGSGSLLGLSNNAAVSLVNAGLLRGQVQRQSIGVNYQDQGYYNGGFGGKIVQSNNGNFATNGLLVGSFGTSYQDQGLSGKVSQNLEYYNNANSATKTLHVGSFGTGYQDQGLSGKLSQNLEYYNQGTKSLHLGTFGTGYQEGVAGNIDIIGGGYSAVGDVKGVDVSNNGANLNFETATIASTIPTVTSVPIPAIKTVNTFESYNGGVVANIPELQLRVKPVQNVQKQVYVSSTVAPISYSTPITVSSPRPFSTNYNYKQVATSVGYSYPKPSVVFEEKPLVQQTIVQQPTVSVVKQPAVSYAYNQNVQTGGYVYEKPKIQFEEKPVVQQTIVQQPVAVYEKPLVQQTIVKQPAVSYAYNQNVQTGGYAYDKPKIRFEEKQQTIIQQPIVQQTIVKQPAVSYTYNQNVQTGGYVYEKPKIQFEEKPVVQQTIVQQPVAVKTEGYVYEKPLVQQTIVKQPAVSYAYNQNVQTGGYVYEKPKIQFEEKPVVQQTIVQQPVTVKTQGYVYEKPTVTFEEKPLVQPAVSYSYNQNLQTEVQQKTIVQQPTVSVNTGYIYEKPKIKFEEKPVVKPAISYAYNQNVQTEGYVYEKPKVQFQETVVQQPAVTVNTGYVYEKPKISFEEKPAVTYQNIDLKTDIVRPVTVQPVIQTYEYRQPQVQVQGYEYPKPAIKFEEKPLVQAAVSSYSYQQPIQTVNYKYQTPVVQQPVQQFVPLVKQKPAVFKTYTYQKPAVTNYSFKDIVLSTPRPVVQGYSYPKPAVTFVEEPVRKPAVVTSFNYVASTTVKPQIQGYVYPKPTVNFVEEPNNYNYVAPTTPKSLITEYRPQVIVQEAVKPVITEYKQPAVVSSYSFVAPTTPKPAVITEFREYVTPRPQVIVQKPIVTEYRQPQVIVQQPTYNYVTSTTSKPAVIQPVITEYQKTIVQTPAVVSSYSYVAPKTPKPVIQQYVTPKPQVIVQQPILTEYNYVASTTSKPAVIQTHYQKPIVTEYRQPAVVSSYNYVAPTTPKAVITEFREYVTPKPQVIIQQTTPILETLQPIREIPFVKKKTYATTKFEGYRYEKPVVKFEERPIVVENYVKPQEYYYVDKAQSTPRPTLATTLQALVTDKLAITTSRPIVRYSFSSLDDQVEITSPRIRYLPGKSRVRVSTTPETFIVPEVTSTRLPAREYLPVTTTVPTPTREYLPVRGRARLRVSTSTTQAYDEDEDEEIEVTSRRPVKVLKVVRPVTKTIIKQNDFLPMLSAKLGAQCTCTSNTVKLRKKPQKIIVVEDDDDNLDDDDDDDDDDDGYQVNANIEDEDGAIVVEDYKYEPQKEVEITPTPEIYIKSTTSAILTSKLRKRVRVTTPATEIFYKSRVTPAVKVVKIVKEEPSDKEIVKAVRTGLKLVKQAAKEGAKEGTAEVISKSFDRYGPGGLRGKNERLQGTIDCQRAGLFRHPTQCNKFYSCRWDCKKNKFTLHVFNCPVHLTFDSNLGACNWPSQGPACLENTLLPSE